MATGCNKTKKWLADSDEDDELPDPDAFMQGMASDEDDEVCKQPVPERLNCLTGAFAVPSTPGGSSGRCACFPNLRLRSKSCPQRSRFCQLEAVEESEDAKHEAGGTGQHAEGLAA